MLIKQFNVAGNGDKDSIEGDESLEFQDPQTTCRVGPSRHAMLLRWIRMEQLLDEIVGNRIHKQVLARAEPLPVYILASAGVLKGIEMQKMWERAVSLHSATDRLHPI